MKSYHLVHHRDGPTVLAMTIRSMLSTTGAALASLAFSCTHPTPRSLDAEAQDLARRSQQANDALMRGDIDRYRTFVRMGDDFTLMSPFGGEPSHWTDDRRLDALRSYFRNGSLSQDLVDAHMSADLAVLAVIEHAHHVEVGGAPAQDWDLRVTLVYRRIGADWRLVHRHADPLGHAISLERAAELGRGAL